MLNQKNFTNSQPKSQANRPTMGYPITRPAELDDCCYYCGGQITGVVTEIMTAPGEIHYSCDYCQSPIDKPLNITLTDRGGAK